jgi:hypothetical protein
LMWNGSEQYMAKLRSESETLKSRFWLCIWYG